MAGEMAPDEDAATLAEARATAKTCRRCTLWRDATQTVFGEGPQDAEVVFVGEQPGDQEDIAGKPFVGPAGKLFDAILGEAGIERDKTYVTNAVKHFKFEPRGKRRIHSKPNAGEVRACRWWLDKELGFIRPKLAVALKPQLETHGLGGRLFELLLFRVDGQVFRLHAGASSPLREPKRIAALFSERFQAVHDDLDAGFGFELLRLNVLHADTFAGAQQDFSGSSDGAASLDAFIDQTVARFGADCLLLPVAHESHLPERAGLLHPAFQAGATQAVSQNHAPLRLERPFRLFARPELMEAIAPVPDGPPILFRWRRTQHQVRRAEGPERIGAEWWVDGEAAPPRDYFRIEDEAGRRYWLFREGLYGETPPRWFMHGVFA